MRPTLLLALLAGCGTPSTAAPDAATDADVVEAAPADACGASYPSGAYAITMGATAPDLTFEGTTKVSLRDYYEPCAARSRILLLRMSATWCGTCRWDLARTKELLSSAVADRMQLLDVLIADEDNVPATVADIPAFRALIDAETKIVLDPAFRLAPARLSFAPLPTYALIDTRTMKIRLVLDNPELLEVVDRVNLELQDLDGIKPPLPALPPRTDGFTRKQLGMLAEMRVPEAPPPDPTNAMADDPKAAKLGETFFSETAFSPSGTVSCATCHDKNKGFADGRATSLGVSTGDRNAPSALLASHARWQFWDGRADTLWAQATGPFENPKEYGSNRLFVAHVVFDRHRAAYEGVFGAMPSLADAARFPANGKPGDATWTAMAPSDQEAVSRVLANVAKAIAAFERTFRALPNALDRYIAGDTNALTMEQKRGLQTYFTAGCAQCHYGPRLTDDAFHVVRFPTSKGDDGRASGIAAFLASEFRGDGPFSDKVVARKKPAVGPWVVGAFKTPPLRGITLTAPYGHDGTLMSLTEVAKLYGTAGLKEGDPRAIGVREPWSTEFVDAHIPEIASALGIFAGTPK